MTLESLDPLPSASLAGQELDLVDGGTLPIPLSRGVRSMSSGATGLATEKFWRMVVKKRNNSVRARPSPRQMRLPVDTEGDSVDTGVNARSLPCHLPKPRHLCPLQ